MHVVRSKDAPAYTAPGHFGMGMRCLQGRDAGPSDALWIGLSVIEPGGCTDLKDSPVEKFYVVLDGVLDIDCSTNGVTQSATLSPLDSCRIAAHEARRLRNVHDRPATVLLVMPKS